MEPFCARGVSSRVESILLPRTAVAACFGRSGRVARGGLLQDRQKSDAEGCEMSQHIIWGTAKLVPGILQCGSEHSFGPEAADRTSTWIASSIAFSSPYSIQSSSKTSSSACGVLAPKLDVAEQHLDYLLALRSSWVVILRFLSNDKILM